MEGYNVYRDISERSGGDVYIGVVGPVRTGKSTFIKKFMDLLVIPNITDTYRAERARDELPQSAAGRTIMTTEPKFIPNEAVEIHLGDNAALRVRMIDCVGYIVGGSLGYIEEDAPRMVNTPWFDKPIPFYEAAELGTKKVITEHSTIGLVVTTDGSITDIAREEYVDAENRVIDELKSIDKPFIILLNSTDPEGERAQRLREELEQRHNVPTLAVNCEELTAADISEITERVLFEFPMREIRIKLPSWMGALGREHVIAQGLCAAAVGAADGADRIRHWRKISEQMENCEYIKECRLRGMDLGCGNVVMDAAAPDNLFYRVLGEGTGFEIADERGLMSLLGELSEIKHEYDKLSEALEDVKNTGYGIVSPGTGELSLDEPKIVKQGGRFGVKLKASAPSIHMIRADIETEHLIYKMKMGIKSEKKYQDFEIEYRIAV